MSSIRKIRAQIEKIPALRNQSPYGPEYQLWDKATERPLRKLFGDEGVQLFKQQESLSIPLDGTEWRRQYHGDLDKKKRILEGLLADMPAHQRSRLLASWLRSSISWVVHFFGTVWGVIVIPVLGIVAGGLVLHYFFGIG